MRHVAERRTARGGLRGEWGAPEPPTIQVEGGSYPLAEAHRLAWTIETLAGLVL